MKSLDELPEGTRVNYGKLIEALAYRLRVVDEEFSLEQYVIECVEVDAHGIEQELIDIAAQRPHGKKDQ